ncbi:MAG: ABC transporter ATP-binding protein [Thermoplasmataceae archaeon]
MPLSFEKLTKFYGKTKVLDAIDMEIEKGEILGFAGINGAGKTSTIKIASGVNFATSGDVFIDGYSITRQTKLAKMEVSWVPETPLLDPFSSPLSIFLEFGAYFGFSRHDIKEKFSDLMIRVGLEEALDKRVGSYSNGMKKRLMIAIALLNDPSNLLLDETFTGLDPQGIQFLRSLILELKKEQKSILISTHVLSELENMADSIAVIHNGRILDITSVQEIMARSIYYIKCTNPGPSAIHVLERFGNVTYEKDAYVLKPSDGSHFTPWSIGKTLEDQGIQVISIERGENLIEKYFFEKIGKT